jgi:hypothetical protein
MEKLFQCLNLNGRGRDLEGKGEIKTDYFSQFKSFLRELSVCIICDLKACIARD